MSYTRLRKATPWSVWPRGQLLGRAGLHRTWPSSVGWAASSGVLAVMLGGVVASAPKYGMLVIVAALGVLAIARPAEAIIGVLVVAAINNDVWLRVRLQAGGTPISVLDMLPFVLLASALSMRTWTPPVRRSALLRAALWLTGVGFVVGVLVGLSDGASKRQLEQIAVIELGLLVTLFAASLAGHVPQWRRAVVTGAIVAAAIVGVELIATYAVSVLTGRSLWGLFGVASVTNISQQLAAGNDSVVRAISINDYLVLPAIGIVALYRRPRYYALGTLLVVGTIVSLERSAWVTLGVTVLIVLGSALLAGRMSSQQLIAFVAMAAVSLLAAFTIAGGFIANRLAPRTQTADVSKSYRTLETDAVWARLESTPATFLAGTGAGVILSQYQAVQVNAGDFTGTTVFENSMFTRWVNFTFLSVLGALLLLLAAFRASFYIVSTAPDLATRTLGAAGLCLPAVLIGGPISGALESRGTLPFWLLAGTVLASWPVIRGDARASS